VQGKWSPEALPRSHGVLTAWLPMGRWTLASAAGRGDRASPCLQGNESRLMRVIAEDGGEEVQIPTCAFSSEPDAILVVDGANEIEGEMPDDGHVFCAVAGA